MSERRLLICGSGGHAKVVADAARSSGWVVIGLLAPDQPKASDCLRGLSVFVAADDRVPSLCMEHGCCAIAAVGTNPLRKRIYEALRAGGVPIATVVHAWASVAPSVTIGEGTVVFAGVVVNPDARVGRNVILNTGCSVDHDNLIADHVHISPGARLGGTVEVGEETHVGIGSTIRNDIRIGARSVVGAGSVVVRDVPDNVVVFGVPARVVRANRE